MRKLEKNWGGTLGFICKQIINKQARGSDLFGYVHKVVFSGAKTCWCGALACCWPYIVAVVVIVQSSIIYQGIYILSCSLLVKE